MNLHPPTWRRSPAAGTCEPNIGSVGLRQPLALTALSARRAGIGALGPRLFPIVFFEGYLLVSLLVFAFGPVGFEIYNPLALYSFVLMGQLAILIGYLLGIARPAHGHIGQLSRNGIMSLTIVATLAILPATLLQRNYANFSLVEALLNPGAMYTARVQELQSREGTPLISIIRVAASPLLGLFFPLGILYIRQCSRAWQMLWRLGLVGIVVEPIFTGAAKGIFDLALLVPWYMWIRTRTSGTLTRPRGLPRAARLPSIARSKRRGTLRFALFTAAVITVALAYFSYSRQSRYGLSGNEYPSGTTGWSSDLYGVTLPTSIEYPTYIVSRYLSQGYLGLSECLDLPFEWCYGIGHSTFLMRYVGILVNDPDYVLLRSYPYRLENETGYSVAHYWHTIYPWLASDLTFPGAILAVGLFGYLLARAWSDSLYGHNPFAAGFLAQILLMFFYIPANNCRLMFSEEAMMFWGLLFLWLATSRRINVRQTQNIAVVPHGAR